MKIRKRGKTSLDITPVVLSLIGLALSSFVFACSNGIDFVNEKLQLDQKLDIPPLLLPVLENGEKVFYLSIQEGTREFFSKQFTKTWGFNGNYLGPTIRMREGDRVRMKITNTLNEYTTVHWHGMHLPAAMDGGPHQLIFPGKTWEPYWTVKNEASTLWYHSHMPEQTGSQIYKGLSGLIIIDNKASEWLSIPDKYGVDDIPLIIQDRKFDTNAQLIYDFNLSAHRGFGVLGDTILVNGTYSPYVEVPEKLVRLRVLNGSNARRYNLGFSDGRKFFQIATDGGFLEKPMEISRLMIAPGERAEITVDMSHADKSMVLMSFAIPSPNPIIEFFLYLLSAINDENQQFKILELRPRHGTLASEALPLKLNEIERLNEADSKRTREFHLGFDMTINKKLMDHTRIDQIVKLGETEIWKVYNDELAAYHDFHIHDVQFLILDLNGKKPPLNESGWKDTVLIPPHENVRIIMKFKDYADPHLPYMFHCHIAEHEDMGMMGQFVIVSDPSTADIRIISPLLEYMQSNKMNMH